MLQPQITDPKFRTKRPDSNIFRYFADTKIAKICTVFVSAPCDRLRKHKKNPACCDVVVNILECKANELGDTYSKKVSIMKKTTLHILLLSIFLLNACVPIFIDLDDGGDNSGTESSQDIIDDNNSDDDESNISQSNGSNQLDTTIIDAKHNTSAPQLSSLALTGNTATISERGFFDLRITDAPIDNIDQVNISIRSIELLHSEKNVLAFDFKEVVVIDLLQLQGSKSLPLFDQLKVPLGHYKQITLQLDNSSEYNNHILRDDQQHILETQNQDYSIKIPANFTVTEEETVSMTIDVDLRQSIRRVHKNKHNETYVLKPVIRLIDNKKAGHITGVVDETLLSMNACDSADIYLYPGKDVEPVDSYELGNNYIGPMMSSAVEFCRTWSLHYRGNL